MKLRTMVPLPNTPTYVSGLVKEVPTARDRAIANKSTNSSPLKSSSSFTWIRSWKEPWREREGEGGREGEEPESAVVKATNIIYKTHCPVSIVLEVERVRELTETSSFSRYEDQPVLTHLPRVKYPQGAATGDPQCPQAEEEIVVTRIHTSEFVVATTSQRVLVGGVAIGVDCHL